MITFGIQKGGSSKTTTSGIVAYLLSEKYKVLAIDMDSQGNLTELLTQRDIYDFQGRTIFEALKAQDANGYIYEITENLHMITADDHIARFSSWLYSAPYKGNMSLVLLETIGTVRDNYDYIIVDTPPALGEQTINALAAADYVVAMFEASKFCYSALSRFLETCGHIQDKVNRDMQIAGILRCLIDTRRTDNKALIELVREEYEDVCFDTVLTRTAATGRISINGFVNNNELNQAVSQHRVFVEELIRRVEE
ncbi:ParA family protein [Paenibacillus sp. VTT E-133291]|uniref:ParA family protein n=1 Tax=Paenibacillus sp. VTT E-133291 TaxID=1986223 RepID=UPI00211B379A|nr:ParA family protein [Paenibacillus sp. VTT E-133291]